MCADPQKDGSTIGCNFYLASFSRDPTGGVDLGPPYSELMWSVTEAAPFPPYTTYCMLHYGPPVNDVNSTQWKFQDPPIITSGGGVQAKWHMPPIPGIEPYEWTFAGAFMAVTQQRRPSAIPRPDASGYRDVSQHVLAMILAGGMRLPQIDTPTYWGFWISYAYAPTGVPRTDFCTHGALNAGNAGASHGIGYFWIAKTTPVGGVQVMWELNYPADFPDASKRGKPGWNHFVSYY